MAAFPSSACPTSVASEAPGDLTKMQVLAEWSDSVFLTISQKTLRLHVCGPLYQQGTIYRFSTGACLPPVVGDW